MLQSSSLETFVCIAFKDRFSEVLEVQSQEQKSIKKGILLFFAFTVGLATTVYCMLELRVYLIALEKANHKQGMWQ